MVRHIANACRASSRRLVASSQEGFALIVALMLLVALSFIGVSALRNVTLQERMAGNQYYRAVALHESDGALRYALQLIQSAWQSDAIPAPTASGSIALWSSLVPQSSIAFFASGANWSGATTVPSLLSTRPVAAQVAIEVLDQGAAPCDSNTECRSYFIRSTTRVVDPVTNASIVTQEWSTYPK